MKFERKIGKFVDIGISEYLQQIERGLNQDLQKKWTDGYRPKIILERNDLAVEAIIDTEDENIGNQVMELMGEHIQQTLDKLCIEIKFS